MEQTSRFSVQRFGAGELWLTPSSQPIAVAVTEINKSQNLETAIQQITTTTKESDDMAQKQQPSETTKTDIVAKLRGIADPDAAISVPMILDSIDGAEQARAALAAAYDRSQGVTDLRVFNLGDGGAMSGLLVAGRRQGTGEAAFLVFLMDYRELSPDYGHRRHLLDRSGTAPNRIGGAMRIAHPVETLWPCQCCKTSYNSAIKSTERRFTMVEWRRRVAINPRFSSESPSSEVHVWQWSSSSTC